MEYIILHSLKKDEKEKMAMRNNETQVQGNANVKAIERKERNARTFSWIYLILATVLLLLVLLFWRRGGLFAIQQNDAAEIGTESVEPEVLGDVESRTDRYIDSIVVRAESLYAGLNTSNAAERNQQFIDFAAELEKLEESDVQRAAYGYISMMHAVAQNIVNQEYDAKYSVDENDCRELVAANKELYYSYNNVE